MYSDETLWRFADGALDPEEARRIEAAAEQDGSLRAR
ncbi:MAG: zf-HC2 domain-containing protein, partial [Planctomycetota bacterium]